MLPERLSRQAEVLIEKFLPRTIAELGRAHRRTDYVKKGDRGQKPIPSGSDRGPRRELLDRRVHRFRIYSEPGRAHEVGLSGEEPHTGSGAPFGEIAHGFR